jgi:drug/metabolite transporter (DMT)-like permease
MMDGRCSGHDRVLAWRSDPRLGYQFAALNAAISGFAVFVNSLGVKTFEDATLYTTLKNGVVGIAMIAPLLGVEARRRELARLRGGQWALLVLIALVAGSVAYALDFQGRKISTPATAAVILHSQFLLVAAFAFVLFREQFSRAVALALPVLAVGLVLAAALRTIRLDAGVPFLATATVLFATGAILVKAALRTVSVVTVVAAKMTLGSIVLFAYLAAAGRLGTLLRLTPLQWGFVLVTGFLLLAFTLTETAGLRHASATAVTAIAAGSPVVTTLFVVATRRTPVHPVELLGLALVLAAVLTVYAVGRKDELRAREVQQEPPEAVRPLASGRVRLPAS